MSEESTALENEIIACDVCMKEIPKSEARSEEASEYVAHFCGLECYDKWKQENNTDEE
ncbi:MAG: DUF3330 domain-containing protein [Gammaproteobacteria bacterium]|nr:DUF3330 domain-containing protein [Gammaproteobacteria bacterium]